MEKYEIKPLIFAIIQGGIDKMLRKRSAEQLIEIGFDGYSFGGLPLGRDGFLDEIVSYTCSLMPENSIRYAMGVGQPEDIKKSISYGYDLFDCVLPTRNGRHGSLYRIDRSSGECRKLNIANAKWRNSQEMLFNSGGFERKGDVSLGFLHYLFKISDPLGPRLASLYNLYAYNEYIALLRKGISKKVFCSDNS